MPLPHPTFGIIGAGFSGTLLAVQLLKRLSCRIHLIERRQSFGKGLAYSTVDPGHLLNVRTARMSAFEDDPSHFLRWQAHRGGDDPHAFVQRSAYGLYLQDILKEQLRRRKGYLSLNLLPEEAVGLVCEDAKGVAISLAGGRTVKADAAILAVGNFPPAAPTALERVTGSPRYVADPWNRERFDAISPDEPVLVIGTGLSMVDCVACLLGRGHRGAVLALSRHGLLSRRHEDVAVAEPWGDDIVPPVPLSRLLGRIRQRSDGGDWRALLDGLRPHLQEWWGAMPEGDRRRFLRHLRPWWDVHRHRLAPQVADWLDETLQAGQLSIAAGRIIGAEATARGIEVGYELRGGMGRRSFLAGHAINCSGPATDISRLADPLLRGLLDAGTVRPDPLRLGLDVTDELRLVGADGRPNPRLFAMGPLTRGRFWEVTAVPDIRCQAAELAERLAEGRFAEPGRRWAAAASAPASVSDRTSIGSPPTASVPS